MRQRPRGYRPDAQGRKRADTLQRDAPGGFQEHPARRDGEGLGDLLVAHIVEHHDVRAGVDRLTKLSERIYFAFDFRGMWCALAGSCDRLGHPTRRRYVVVFDEHSRAQVVSVIVTAATSHGVALERAQPRCGLASVCDSRIASRCFGRHIAMSEGGDAAHALQQIERNSLTHENRTRIAAHFKKHSSRFHHGAVFSVSLEGQRRIHGVEHMRGHRDACSAHAFSRHTSGRPQRALLDAALGGQITARQVFEQGTTHHFVDHKHGQWLEHGTGNITWLRGRASVGSMSRLLALAALFAISVLASACVPSGDSPAKERKAASTSWAEDPLVLRAPFEESFERSISAAPDAGSGDARAIVAVANDYGLGPNWYSTAAPGVWRVQAGKLCGQKAYNHGVWLRKPIPANARVEFDAVSDSPTGDIKAELWGDGKSYAKGNSYVEATSYLVLYGAWMNTKHGIARINEHGNDVSFVKVDPGSGEKKQLPVARGQVYHMRVERIDGKTVHMYVDDTLIANFNDATPLVGLGHDHFGFNDWETPVCFDNVKITPSPR